MNFTKHQLWERFQKYYTEFPELGLAVDVSRMSFADDSLPSMESRIQAVLQSMTDLEKGAIANQDDNTLSTLKNPIGVTICVVVSNSYQHYYIYIQQLRDGLDNFFVNVHRDVARPSSKICEHLVADPDRNVKKVKPGNPFVTVYRAT